MIPFVMPRAVSQLETKKEKAGMWLRTTILFNNHYRELSEVHKVPLRSNSKSQSVYDNQVPKGWLSPKKPED